MAKVKAEVKEAPKEKVEKFSQNLKCTLTAQEVAARADRAASLVAMIEEKDNERKAASKHAQGEIDQLTAELMQLSGEVRTRATYRNVECERRFVYTEGMVRETRLDSFDLLNTRKMTEREMQLDLFPEGGGDVPDDGLWRAVPIAEALNGLPKKCYDAFEAKAIATMGDFADFQAKHGEFWIKDLPGVGPGMAEKISDAAMAFWSGLKVKATADAIPDGEMGTDGPEVD